MKWKLGWFLAWYWHSLGTEQDLRMIPVELRSSDLLLLSILILCSLSIFCWSSRIGTSSSMSLRFQTSFGELTVRYYDPRYRMQHLDCCHGWYFLLLHRRPQTIICQFGNRCLTTVVGAIGWLVVRHKSVFFTMWGEPEECSFLNNLGEKTQVADRSVVTWY